MNDNSFRGFDIDAERGYADKALWLNYLSVGFVGDEIPAVRYNIVRRGVPTGGGGPSEIQVPEAVRRANDPARFVDWLLSVLPATSPGDREKYLKNIRLQAYCRQIAGQPQPIIRVQDAVYRYEGSETDGMLEVVGKNHEGAGIREETSVHSHAVHDTTHTELPDAVEDVVARVSLDIKRDGA